VKLFQPIALVLFFSAVLCACEKAQDNKTFSVTVDGIERSVLALDSDISIAHDAYLVALGNAPTNDQKEYAIYCSKNVIPLLNMAASKAEKAKYDVENMRNETQNNQSLSNDQRNKLNTFLGLMEKVYILMEEYYSSTILAQKSFGSGQKVVETILEEAEGKRGASDANRVLASALFISMKKQGENSAQK
jgi:hypothetical protein